MSFITSVEQFRTKYIFLAPDDYPVSYVDIVFPDGAIVKLDGVAPASGAPIVSTGYYLSRSRSAPAKRARTPSSPTSRSASKSWATAITRATTIRVVST